MGFGSRDSGEMAGRAAQRSQRRRSPINRLVGRSRVGRHVGFWAAMARRSSASGASFSSHDSIELSSPPAVPTAAPSRCQRRDSDRGRRAGDHRPGRRRARACRRARPRHDRTACSTRAAGSASPAAAASARAPRTRYAQPSPRSRQRAGDFAIRCPIAVGDIDSVAIAPTGIAFAIETKTRTFHAHHLANTREMAAWLYRYRRRWCRSRRARGPVRRRRERPGALRGRRPDRVA